MIEYIADAYRLNFTIQLLAVELLLIWSAPKKTRFPLRLLLGGAAYIAFCLLFPDPLGIPIVGSSVIRLAALGLMLFLFEASWRQILFVCVSADILQNISLNISLMLRYQFDFSPLAIVLTYIVTITLICLVWVFVRNSLVRSFDWNERDNGIAKLAISIACVMTHFAAESALYAIGLDKNPISRFSLALTGIFIIAIQYLLQSVEKMNSERKLMITMLENERERYNISRSNLEVINMKYHDMKHQLSALRSAGERERAAAMEELENAIESYDTVARTGNEPLDTIITEKLPHCRANGITFNYLVDAERLRNIASLDIYSLFGNAIDNAIEAVTELPEGERSILLRVLGRGNMTVIHVENTCAGEPKIVDGNPVSEKGEGHGYGTVSIRSIAKKYGGTVTFSAENGKFSLDMLLAG